MTFPRITFILIAFLFPTAAGNIMAGEKKVVVHKKNGGRVEGKIIEDNPGWILLKTRFGNIKIFRADIKEITKGITPETLLKIKRKKIRDSDARALMKLAKWCERNKLPRDAIRLYQEAANVAGPHYLEANFALARLGMSVGEYRLAVERYLDLAFRLKQQKAWTALKGAEDKLRRERMYAWKRANEELENKRYQRAIIGYCNTLYRTVRDEPEMGGDIGRNQVKKRILETRKAYFEWLRNQIKVAPIIETDPVGISWHYTPRPGNLRSRSWSVTIEQLRLETERYVARWLALRGTYQGPSQWDSGQVRAIRISAAGHPGIAVAAYLPAAKTIHQNMLASRSKGSAYLEELIRIYPYTQMPANMDLLSPGNEVVCYGRLRKRERKLPQYVFEVWATEAVQDPQAVQLAEYLKIPLSCEFDETPLKAVLDHIAMLSQVKVKFAGRVPDVPISLTLANKPTGYAIHKLARKLNLKWTREGAHVLMKKELTPRDKLLLAQVRRLATDTAGK